MKLPDDVLLYLFHYLSPLDLARVAQVSRVFREQAGKDCLWIHKLKPSDTNSSLTGVKNLFFTKPEQRLPGYLLMDKKGLAYLRQVIISALDATIHTRMFSMEANQFIDLGKKFLLELNLNSMNNQRLKQRISIILAGTLILVMSHEDKKYGAQKILPLSGEPFTGLYYPEKKLNELYQLIKDHYATLRIPFPAEEAGNQKKTNNFYIDFIYFLGEEALIKKTLPFDGINHEIFAAFKNFPEISLLLNNIEEPNKTLTPRG